MPSFTVTREMKGTPETVFKQLKTYCDEKLILKELGNLKPVVTWELEKQCGQFDEKGVRGELKVVSGRPTAIKVFVELPFLMSPFKKMIAQSIQDHLAKLT